MIIHKSYRFRIYPTQAQIDRLVAWGDALRFLWNIANEQRRLGYARPKGERRYPTAISQILELTELRKELPWLAEVPRSACEGIIFNLGLAWSRMFDGIGERPNWRSRRDAISVSETHAEKFRLSENAIRFPKIGIIRAVTHRRVDGKPKSCTIKRDGDQWFASIVCEIEISEPSLRTSQAVAIDRGVTNTIATSDGLLVSAPKHLEAAAKRLARAQRTVSRRKKGSKNREKAKARVSRLHRKVRRQREHFLHELTTKIAKSHGVVVVEKLQIASMSAYCNGKQGLNRSILAAGWGRMVEMLRYKLAWIGGTLIEVNPAYSSQTCSACGLVDARSRRTQAEFHCTGCGHAEHADVNAAKVLLTRANRSGLPIEGDGSRRSRKRSRPARNASRSLENT